MGYDKDRVSADAAKIDPRVGGQVVGMRNMIGEAFKLLIDPRYYQMSPDILAFLAEIEEGATKLMGLHDLVSMSKAAQIPGSDTIEKLAEMAGPIATDMSRNMEASIRDLGELWKAMFFEFYSVRKRFQILGKDGVTREDFDFDPSTLVPSNIDLPMVGRGGTRAERARVHMRNFHFSIVPNSIYQMTQSTRRLLLLQLARMGMPLPPKYLMDQFDIPNPQKRIDEFWEYKAEEAQKMTQIQIMASAMNPVAQMLSHMQGAMQGGGNPQGEGRPPSGQSPPHVEQKDGGMRTTISES